MGATAYKHGIETPVRIQDIDVYKYIYTKINIYKVTSVCSKECIIMQMCICICIYTYIRDDNNNQCNDTLCHVNSNLYEALLQVR